MDQRIGWLALGLALGVGLVACSSKVLITAESTTSGASSAQGTSSGHPGGTGGMSGSGSSAQGSSSGSPGGTGGMSSGSGTSGTGAVGSGKVVTADNDIGQYASFTVAGTDMGQKILDGAFFVTDVHCEGNIQNAGNFYVVTGASCSAPMSQQTPVLASVPAYQAAGDWHGIKLPVLAGQTLCVSTPMGITCTVLGFRPY